MANVYYLKDRPLNIRGMGKRYHFYALCWSPVVWLIEAGFGWAAFLQTIADGVSLLHLLPAGALPSLVEAYRVGVSQEPQKHMGAEAWSGRAA